MASRLCLLRHARAPFCSTEWLLIALLVGATVQIVLAAPLSPSGSDVDELRALDPYAPLDALQSDQHTARHAAAHGDSTGAEIQLPPRSKVPVLSILAMTCFMSGMAGFGAVPFFFVGKLQRSWAGLANAVACGVMLAASFDLLHEGAPYSPGLTILGMVLGAFFIKSSQEFLERFEDASFEDLSGADARKAMLIVGVMAAHALGEGSGVGVSFSGNRGWAQGMLVTIAIGLHNIPEGMAVATVMVSKGAPPRKALFWSLFCAFPQALVAVPAFLFVETFTALLPVAMGFAAGCMVWIVAAELMPDALDAAPHPAVATAATLSAAWLQGLSMWIATLENAHGALSSPVKASPWALVLCVLGLLPGLAALPAAAHAAAQLLPALPVALGASAGVMLGLGGAGLLDLLAGGLIRPGATLLWAGLGAGAVAVLRAQLMASSSHLQARRSLDAELAAAETARPHGAPEVNGAPYDSRYTNGAVGHHHEGNGNKAHPWAYPSGPTSASAFETVDLAGSSPAGPPLTALLNGVGKAGATWADGAGALSPGGGGLHVRVPAAQGRAGLGQEINEGWHGGLNGGAPGGHPLAVAPHGKGIGVLYPTPPPHAGHVGMDIASSAAWTRGAKAALLGAIVLACHATCDVGLRSAVATAAHASDVNVGGDGAGSLTLQWVLPVMLQGLPIGLACAGLSKSAFGAGRTMPAWLAAACILGVLTASLICLAGTDLGATSPPQLAQRFAKEAHWVWAAQAASAGAMVAGAVGTVWPAAVASRGRRARSGAVLGLLVVGACQLLRLGLCAGTPYCMRV